MMTREIIQQSPSKKNESTIDHSDLFSAALLGVRDGIIITDLNGHITLMNRMAENLAGINTQEALGKAVEDICLIADEITLIPVVNPVREALTKNWGVVSRDIVLTAANGITFSIDAGAEPVHDKSGEIIGAVFTFRDVTEEKLNMKELKAAQLRIEENHNKMQSSIEYTRKIQDAIMPSKTLLNKNFNDSFILYKPKDIISGDFYWFAEAGNKFIVAVADCTGHGVPGAFLSAIGCSSLNEIVNNKRITRPSEILSELDLTIRQLILSEKDGYRCQDGMEMAICSFDRVTGKLEYAGANRPLFCMSDNVLSIINGDKNWIGGDWAEEKKQFTNHLVPFSKGDLIYLFSDGYSDQFGGKEEKKMMKRNFIKLLDAIVTYDIPEQEMMLSQWLDRWKGKLEQTDDILLVGIKL